MIMLCRRTIRELLEHRMENTPCDLFGVHEGKKISFSVLGSRVNCLANRLAEAGVGPGKTVAVMLLNHPDHIFTFFAIASLGAVWIPININLRGQSLAYIFDQCCPEVLIIEDEFWDRLEQVEADKKVKTIIIRNSPETAKNSNINDFAAFARGDDSRPSMLFMLVSE